jgi:uncharacterized protein
MRCPICNVQLRPEMKPHRPFCSARCKAIDLGKWLTESYRIPVEDDDDAGPGRGSRELGGEPDSRPPKPIGDA